MHDIRFLDETLDINNTYSYHLSIQAGLDGFSFVILDPAQYKYIALKHYSFDDEVREDIYPDHLSKLLVSDEFLSREYGSVSCIWCTSRTTLLPAVLFEKDKLKSYFEFNHVLNDLDELHANHLKNLDTYLIFPVHHEIANVFSRQYPNLKFFNQAAPLIEFALDHSFSDPESVHVNILKDFFDILVLKNTKLILHNTFKYRNERDLIYFIMNIYDKLFLTPDNIPVYLSGMIEKNSAIAGIIKSFIKTVNYSGHDIRFRYAQAFNSIPGHFFTQLFSLYHCGS